MHRTLSPQATDALLHGLADWPLPTPAEPTTDAMGAALAGCAAAELALRALLTRNAGACA